MTLDTPTIVVIAVSELVAAWIVRRTWRASIHWAEKVAISLLALVPVIGPAFALLVRHDAGPAHPAFRDDVRNRTDVLDRWRHVLDEKDPVVRQRKWQELMRRHDNDETR